MNAEFSHWFTSMIARIEKQPRDPRRSERRRQAAPPNTAISGPIAADESPWRFAITTKTRKIPEKAKFWPAKISALVRRYAFAPQPARCPRGSARAAASGRAREPPGTVFASR